MRRDSRLWRMAKRMAALKSQRGEINLKLLGGIIGRGERNLKATLLIFAISIARRAPSDH